MVLPRVVARLVNTSPLSNRVDLAWQVCAAQGRLPGQGGAQIRFATAPKDLSIDEWRHPTSWPCEGGKPCPKGKYAVGDVFYVEIAVYRAICRSSSELFQVSVGDLVSCEVDEAAFRRFVARLMQS